MLDKIKKQTHGKVRNDRLTETAFEWLEYSEIISYLFSERYFEYTAEQAIDDELSDEKLRLLSKEDIIKIISKARKETLWDKLFFNNKNVRKLTKRDIESFRIYRNDVMHHHTICEKKFKTIQKEIGKANQNLRLAINEVESKIYTQEEYGAVFSLSANIITGIISTFNRIFDIKLLDVSNAISETFENLSKIMANVVPNITKTTNHIMKMIMYLSEMPDYSMLLETLNKPIEIPDYSKSFDSLTIQQDFQDYQQDIENHSESSS